MEIDLEALAAMLDRQLKLIRAARGLMKRMGIESEILAVMDKETKSGLDMVKIRLAEIERDKDRPFLNRKTGGGSP